MNQDLHEVIETSKRARDAVLNRDEGSSTTERTLLVKEANTVASNNHTIVMSHGLDLRERIFEAESQGLIAPPANGAIEGEQPNA